MNSTSETKRDRVWWAALWRGLVVDPQSRHYQNMQSSVWLFLYLVLHANRTTGQLARRYETIMADTGISHRTLRVWLARLKQHHYITVQSNGRGLDIHILKWKALSAKRRVAEFG